MKMKAAIARLENRLEKCFNRQNLTEAMNKQLKLSIDDLRYEKQQLLRSNAKGEQQLAKRKGQLRHEQWCDDRVFSGRIKGHIGGRADGRVAGRIDGCVEARSGGGAA